MWSVCSTSFTDFLTQAKCHWHSTTHRELIQFSHLLSTTVRPVINHGCLRETLRNCWRCKLSLLTSLVVTVPVCRTKSNTTALQSCCIMQGNQRHLHWLVFILSLKIAEVEVVIDRAMRLFVLNYANISCICVYSLINLCSHVNISFWSECLLKHGSGCCTAVSVAYTVRIT